MILKTELEYLSGTMTKMLMETVQTYEPDFNRSREEIQTKSNCPKLRLKL